MNVKDKIESESLNEPLIFLYMEGMFWKAYEQSAMRFTNDVKCYKLLKKQIKSVGKEVVALGFPDSSLADTLGARPFTRINEKQISLAVTHTYSPEEFEEWKASIPLMEDAVVVQGGTQRTASAVPATLAPAIHEVIVRLKNFRVETASPIQCMMLVSELQSQLNQ